ncbi:M1 family peptidase [Streptomyces sp. SID4919]|uniref:M1 family metallopeptidase n=1 Tax=unclassified Streptomyces TaxID=2593676 RepID=UPI00082389EC|nr:MULTISPECIES: M1 family metallopeptidase [unclassified Streptomyces]MYY09583.1 M1 family peptidase [Streptomyces sp. SID4919]SCK62501.1 Aminopeptidase N [Streptomyces sp. AmelKG-E11A]
MLLIDRSRAPRPSRPPGPKAPRTRGALLAVAATFSLVAASVPAPAVPLGVGDRLFPHLGNPGYDVTAYDLSFTYPGSNDKPLAAVTRIDALAVDRLERFNLDFAYGRVTSVVVNGAPARWAAVEEDLVVTPATTVPRGTHLRVTVHHTSDPAPGGDNDSGWVRTTDGLAMANQADAAHRVFPCNDHPSDKAAFTFRVTAPSALTAVANGLPAGVTRDGGTTTWTYRTVHPMATELAQVSIGASTVVHRDGPHGLPLRDVVPTKDRDTLEPWLRRTPEQITWMEEKVGGYPFETYGLLVAEARTGFELETQTLSLFERDLLLGGRYPDWYIESIMVHELAHQWFGNSVTPRAWSDLWLNEGHATWYEAVHADEKGHRPLETRMRDAYLRSDEWRASGGPPAMPKAAQPGQKISIFRPIVYEGSALVLYALRQKIGHRAFERLERLWVTTYRDRTATTENFTDLASAVSGRDLRDFFQGWLHGTTTPPMPGHPEWSDPPPPATSRGESPDAEPTAPTTHHHRP